jgi:hypothetical protein
MQNFDRLNSNPNIYSMIVKKNKSSKKNKLNQICNECGKSVKAGSGLFVNRTPDFNDYKVRIEMQKPFPEGAYICIGCEEKLNFLTNAGNKRISD